MLQVRNATPEDLNAIHQIEMECFGAAGVSLEQLRWILEKQGEKPAIFLSTVFESEEPAQLMGFLCWKSNPGEGAPHYEILDLGVAKLYRREGAAQAMIEDLIARAKKEEHLGLVCYLNEGNPDAFAMFEKIGFVVQKVIQKYYQDGTNAFLIALKV